MARSRGRTRDLTGIRQRGSTYQVRVFSGVDPVTGKKAYLTGSAPTEDKAIELRDRFLRDISANKAARTSVAVGYLLDEWLASHRVELKTRESYELLIAKFIRPTFGRHHVAQARPARPASVRASVRRSVALPAPL